jgi:hypothetical protein
MKLHFSPLEKNRASLKTRFRIWPHFATLMACLAVGISSAQASQAPVYTVEDSWEIAEVPAGFPVGFCLLTSGQKQYAAYYDDERRMTVASRLIDSDKWTFQVLPSKVGWDSHNYITMAVDDEGQLHVSGNMHASPLVYFRTESPGDVTTLEKMPMTGEKENRATYPKFIRDAEGRLVFHYRHGGSGRGIEIYNLYDPEAGQWQRLLDQPLIDGEGRMNAYMDGPKMGPDGWFHMHWVWRDTPDCATNHHLSYARSKDLLHWESAFGHKVTLPVVLGQKSLWVDPIPSRGGIINGGHKLFFDANQRPVITYHKRDAEDNMQIYAARAEEGQWVIRRLTNWDAPVPFSGRGSMGFIGIRIKPLERVEPGLLTMTYQHKDYGNGRLVIDEATLRPLDKKFEMPPDYSARLNRVRSDFPGMTVQRTNDIGDSGDPATKYILQWETLKRNFDRPRQPPLPEPSMLRLYKLTSEARDGSRNY